MTGSVNDRGEGRFTRAKERFSQLAFLLKERDADNYLLWYFRDVSDLNKEGNFGYRIDNESYDIYFSLLSSYFVKADNSSWARTSWPETIKPDSWTSTPARLSR